MQVLWEDSSLSGFRTHTVICMPAILLLAACASSPVDDARETTVSASVSDKESTSGRYDAAALDLIKLKVDSSVPLLQRNRADKDPLLASNFSVGVDEMLSYKATYVLEPGDVLAFNSTKGSASPTRYAGQRVGQNVKLQLPKLAGTPLSLGVSTEFSNNWLVSGYTQLQRERADLNWSPGPATVNVQWAGAATAFDPSLALTCDLQSTVRVQTHKSENRSAAVRLSSRDCVVATDDVRYAGIEAQIWGLGYVWSRSQHQSEAVLSMIDPVWMHGVEYQHIDPSYEFGFRHRRDFGPLSAKAYVSLRQATIWDTADPANLTSSYIGVNDTNWAADATLTWELPHASLSANWARGVDRFWFTPDVGQRSDRFGLALNLSRWVENLAPHSSPRFAMNWNWSQLHLPDEQVTGNNSLRVDMALMF